MNARLAMLLPLALLAACDRKERQASVEINAGNGTTEIKAEPGKEGGLKIDTPGVKADIKLPFMGLLTEKMEIDGVRLYPGSKIAGVNVNATDRKSGDDDGRFAVRFQAPATRDKVADWFRMQFAANGFKMTLRGSRFTGTDEEGHPVTLDVRDAASGSTEGEFRIGGK